VVRFPVGLSVFVLFAVSKTYLVDHSACYAVGNRVFFTGGGGRANRSDPESDHSHKGADQPGNYMGRQLIKDAKTSLEYSEI
jgi:hypothetical protein